jgi:DNA-binding Lrp family transcriptional regulator
MHAVRDGGVIAELSRETRMIAEALEGGVPLVREPFAEISSRLGMSEDDVLGVARDMRASGFMRRFGAFFDYGRLGYRGFLFGADMTGPNGAEMIAEICAMPSVTHAYGRRHEIGFWFTALFDGESLSGGVCSRLRYFGCRFVALGAVGMIKLRPSFVSRGSDEVPLPVHCGVGRAPPGEPAIAAVRGLQRGIEIEKSPFAEAAGISGVDMDEFLCRARRLARGGILRRIGASFDHHRAGWASNSLCAFDLPGADGAITRIAGTVARWPWVSHCYLRELRDCDIRGGWPYNLYMMIHAESDEMLAERENMLRGELGCGFVSLRTDVEYKKIPFKI